MPDSVRVGWGGAQEFTVLASSPVASHWRFYRELLCPSAPQGSSEDLTAHWDTFVCLFVYSFGEEVILQPRQALNLCSCCLILPNAGMTGLSLWWDSVDPSHQPLSTLLSALRFTIISLPILGTSEKR